MEYNDVPLRDTLYVLPDGRTFQGEKVYYGTLHQNRTIEGKKYNFYLMQVTPDAFVYCTIGTKLTSASG